MPFFTRFAFFSAAVRCGLSLDLVVLANLPIPFASRFALISAAVKPAWRSLRLALFLRLCPVSRRSLFYACSDRLVIIRFAVALAIFCICSLRAAASSSAAFSSSFL